MSISMESNVRQPTETTGPTRAEWQRGTGAFILDHYFRQNMPNTPEEINDRVDGFVADSHKFDMDPDNILDTVQWLTFYAARDIDPTKLDAGCPKIESDLGSMTFAKNSADVLGEIRNTLSFFPINLLEYAQQNRPSNMPPVFEALSDIGRIYQEDWFLRQITYAAATTNGVWGGFSVTTGREIMKQAELQLDYAMGENGTEFSFTPEARQLLIEERKESDMIATQRGELYSSRFHDGRANSSSGCPVNRRRAQITDPEEINTLAETYGVSPEEVTALHPDTGIEFTMKCLGRLIERAAEVQGNFS